MFPYSELRPKIGLTLVVIVLITIIMNAVNFLYCFIRDLYRALRLLYYKILFWCERLMKKSMVAKMIPFHKEEEVKKKLPHPADTKCMINDKLYFVSTLDTVVNTDLNLKLKNKNVIKINKPLAEFDADVSDLVSRLPKPLVLKVPAKPPIPEMPEDLELRLAAGLYLKPKSVQFWNKSRGLHDEGVEDEKKEEEEV